MKNTIPERQSRIPRPIVPIRIPRPAKSINVIPKKDIHENQGSRSDTCNREKSPTTAVKKDNKHRDLKNQKTSTNNQLTDHEKKSKLQTTADHDKDQKEEKSKKTKPTTLFAEYVTIAGVEDIHKSKILVERWMFVAAMVSFFVGMIITCVNVAPKYTNPQVVYDHYPIADYQPPFPNVSVCIPNSMNATIFRQLLIIPNKTEKLIQRKNLNLQEIINYTMEAWSYDRRLVTAKNPLISQASLQIMRATVSQFPRGYADLLLAVYPTCGQTLSNCFFYGKEFDCCEAAEFIFINENILCYYISVSRAEDLKNKTTVTGGLVDNSLSLNSSGLVVNVSFDWSMATYFDNLAEDGFHTFVGTMFPTVAATVPSGADAVMTIESKKLFDLTQCRSSQNLPKMEFFDYYDPFGVLYLNELNTMQVTKNLLNCTMPMLTYSPQNVTSCPVDFFYYLKLFMSTFDGEIFRTDSKTNPKMGSMKGLASLEEEYEKAALPICDRWYYKIATASYGYVQKQGQFNSEPERRQSGRVWSRIRFIFPTASYLLVEEQPPNTFSVAMSDIGGIVGMYFGASAITVVQLVAYGGFALYYLFVETCLKRKNRVGVIATKSA